MVKSWAGQCLSSSEHLFLLLTASHSCRSRQSGHLGHQAHSGYIAHTQTNVHTQKLNNKSVGL